MKKRTVIRKERGNDFLVKYTGKDRENSAK
jgi:hypothetical protein